MTVPATPVRLLVPPLAADGLPPGWPQDHGVPTLAPDILAWSECELAQPDGDEAGRPWQWRESQARYMSWWYSVDERGRFLWRRGQIVLPKGSGKSPIAGAASCCSLAGPVHFDGWDASGNPVGRPHPSPWVQLAAVSQDQTDNTMSLVLAMLREGPAAHSVRGLDLGLTRVRTRNGILQPVTASATSREGQRSTDAILDEPHLWVRSNGGVQLAATIRRNLAKMAGRSLETTNAWIPGQGSVAESTYDYAEKVAAGVLGDQAAGDLGVLRWHPFVDIADLSDRDAVRAGLVTLYADSPWVDVDRVLAEVYDLGTDPQDARRFYLNQVTHATDSWLSGPEWRACTRRPDGNGGPGEEPPPVVDGDVVTLGFDGSRARARGVTDATALVGCRVTDGHVFLIDCWEQPQHVAPGEWRVPTATVDATVRDAFRRYRVVAFYADPARWESYVASWEADLGAKLKVKATRANPIEWWMTGGRAGSTVRALEQFHGAVIDRELTHDGSETLTRHVLNARRRVSQSGVQIAKQHPESADKIDAAVAAVLAWQARLDALAAGAATPPARRYAPSRIR